jgi:predicted CXXCH cytochrome family protein
VRLRIIGLLAAAALFGPVPALAQTNGCVDCHAQLDDELQAPVAAFAADVHREYGLSCRDCHGGNPNTDDIGLAKDGSYGGAPKRDRIPRFCGGCHADAAAMRAFNPSLRTDQLSQYETSRHGQLLKAGDTRVAVCTDCHGVHGILPASLPKSTVFPWNIPRTCGRCHADAEFMKGYRIPTDQVDEYRRSVHANALFEKKDLSAPVCNDCHGNHGAFPPSVTSVAAVCRQCHPSAGELFGRSPHKKAFDDLGMAECETCHGNHRIETPTTALIGTDDAAVCVQCHDPGSRGYETAAELRRMLDGLAAGTAEVQGLLARAKRKGVEVSDAEFDLAGVKTVLVSAGNLTHGLDGAEIAKTVAEGEKALAGVRAASAGALDEARFRRRGLAVTTVILALLAAALALKVRRMTEDRRRGGRGAAAAGPDGP